MSESDGTDRRRLLVALAGVGAVGLAGCVGDMEDGENGTADLVPSSAPSPPPEAGNEYWDYVVASLDYQNRLLAREFE